MLPNYFKQKTISQLESLSSRYFSNFATIIKYTNNVDSKLEINFKRVSTNLSHSKVSRWKPNFI